MVVSEGLLWTPECVFLQRPHIAIRMTTEGCPRLWECHTDGIQGNPPHVAAAHRFTVGTCSSFACCELFAIRSQLILHAFTGHDVQTRVWGEMQTAVDNPERAVIKAPVPPSSADTQCAPLPVTASPRAKSAYLSLRKDCL